MIGTGIAMFIAAALLLTHLPAHFVRRAVGYGLVTDIVVLCTLLFVFGGTGQERLGAIAATIGVTGALHTYKYLLGYEKLTRRGWVRYTGIFTRLPRATN